MSAKTKVDRNSKIVVQQLDPPPSSNAALRSVDLVRKILPDCAQEAAWKSSLRPERCLVSPAAAFVLGHKQLRPALNFNSFDSDVKREMRRRRREQKGVPCAAQDRGGGPSLSQRVLSQGSKRNHKVYEATSQSE